MSWAVDVVCLRACHWKPGSCLSSRCSKDLVDRIPHQALLRSFHGLVIALNYVRNTGAVVNSEAAHATRGVKRKSLAAALNLGSGLPSSATDAAPFETLPARHKLWLGEEWTWLSKRPRRPAVASPAVASPAVASPALDARPGTSGDTVSTKGDSGQGGCPSAAAADGNGHACETRASGATASGAEADGDVDMGASPEVVVDDEGDVDMHT